MAYGNMNARRRFFQKANNYILMTKSGENSVAIDGALKLCRIEIDIVGKDENAQKLLRFRGKNLFNPAMEYQPTYSEMGNDEYLREGLAMGQSFFYGLGAPREVGAKILMWSRNGTQIIVPIKKNKSYTVTGYFNNQSVILDENFYVLKVNSSQPIVNDVNGRYLAYGNYNMAYEWYRQPYTIQDILDSTLIEEGDVATAYERFVTPVDTEIPNEIRVNGTPVPFPFYQGDRIIIDYINKDFKYNLWPLKNSILASELLSLKCFENQTVIELEGFSGNITVQYYVKGEESE